MVSPPAGEQAASIVPRCAATDRQAQPAPARRESGTGRGARTGRRCVAAPPRDPGPSSTTAPAWRPADAVPAGVCTRRCPGPTRRGRQPEPRSRARHGQKRHPAGSAPGPGWSAGQCLAAGRAGRVRIHRPTAAPTRRAIPFRARDARRPGWPPGCARCRRRPAAVAHAPGRRPIRRRSPRPPRRAPPPDATR
jgi:hypothetical protein